MTDETITFTVRMPRSTVAKLDDAAETLGMSRNAFMNMLCAGATGGGTREVMNATLNAIKQIQEEKKAAKPAAVVADA